MDRRHLISIIFWRWASVLYLIHHGFVAGGAGQRTNYEEILSSLKYEDKLVFDVTKPFNEKLSKDPSAFLGMHSFNQIGVRLSPILYFIPEEKFHSHFSRDVFEKSSQAKLSIETLPKFLFGSKLIEGQHVNSTIPLLPHTTSSFLKANGALNDEQFAVIQPVIEYNYDIKLRNLMFLADKNLTGLKRSITDIKYLRKNLKAGLEYIGEIVHDKTYPPLISLVDVVILDVDIPLEGFFLSYSSFKNNLREIIDKKYEVIQIENSNCKVYIKLNLFPDDMNKSKVELKMDGEMYQKYYYYLLQFVVFWVNEEKNEGIILETFHTSLGEKEGLDGAELNSLLAIQINSGVDYEVCEFKAMMDHVSPYCSSVTLEKEKEWERKGLLERIQKDKCILMAATNNGTGCNRTEGDLCNRPDVLRPMPEINLRYFIDDDTDDQIARDQINDITGLLSDLPWKLFEVYLWLDLEFDESFLARFGTEILSELLPPEVTVACERVDNASDEERIIETTREYCGFMWNRSSVFVWTIVFPNEGHVNDLTRRLTFLEGKRQQFLLQYPGKSIKLRVFLTITPQLDPSSCSPEVEAMNEKAETVMNFARIHNAPVEITYYANVEGWRSVKTVERVDRKGLGFPAFVHRDYPDKFLMLDEFHTDPCFTWTDLVPKEGIALDPEYGGTTVFMSEMKNGSLTPDELETMLVFACHKFSLIELVPARISDLETIIVALSQQRLVEQLEADGSKPVQLYLKIGSNFTSSGGESEVKITLEKLNKLAKLNVTGIHFENWNDTQLIPDLGLMVGISLEDCIAEVNHHFRNIISSFHNFPQMDYILCNVNHPIEASNTERRQAAKYLDTTLYIRKYFERMFPNDTQKELIFRLNPVPSQSQPTEFNVRVDGKIERVVKNKVSDFLTFFADANRYASNYKMKFFMFPTFDDWKGSRYGWWQVLDHDERSSLANASVYLEKEAEYLNQESWRPTEETPEELEEPDSMMVILVGVATVLLICAAFLLRLWYKRRFVLLSKKEVDTFLYGGAAKDGSSFDDQKFPKQFVISRKRFLLCNIIGKGNFGVVYNATLTDEDGLGSTSVAVKLPPPDCSRESIKSMLSELKVLCYVGEHPHVLQFVGAYIKEIGRGIVYIATELCENGALQEYLRKLDSELLMGRTEGTEGMESPNLTPILNELYRFSHEIALGMEYIASKKIVHGDLSTRNILLNSNMKCKIGDFGLSRKLYEYQQEYIKSKDGDLALPWRWLAIESLKDLKFTTQSDVWSYGITLWEIFSLGAVPYPGLTYNSDFKQDLENGVRMSAPKHSTDAIYEQMKGCWKLHPEHRPSFPELSQFFCAARSTEYTQLELDSETV